jgi:hypothetical protein
MTYVLVTWPDSQMLMDYQWFHQCVLINEEKQIEIVGPSAYLVPEHLYSELLESLE